MKKHHLYSIPCLALSCAIAPCSAVQPVAVAGQSAVASDLSKPVSPELAAKRAERMGLAALFPREMCGVAGVFDIPGIIRDGRKIVNVFDSLDEGKPNVECDISSPVVDIMAGFGPSWVSWANENQDVFAKMGEAQMQTYLGLIKLMADDNGGDVGVMNATGTMVARLASVLDLRPSQNATAPLMVAAKLTPEGLAQVKATLKDINLPEDALLHGIVSLYDKTYNGVACKVAEVDCKNLSAKLEEQMGSGLDKLKAEDQAMIKAAIKRLQESKLYLAVSIIEDKVVAFVTTNPERQVRLASAPQASMLARADFSMADAHLQHPAYGLAFVDKAACEALLKTNKGYYGGMFTVLPDVLKELGSLWKVANQAPSLAALDVITTQYMSWYEFLLKNVTTCTYYAWQDKGVHLEASVYPMEILKLDAPTAMNSVRPGADTVLYWSGCADAGLINRWNTLVSSASQIVWDYGNAYIASPKNDVSDQVKMVAPMLQMALPTIQEFWAAEKMAVSGMTGSKAVIVDMKGAPCPMMQNIPAPRFAVVEEVKNRAALAEAWNKASQAAKTVVTLASQGKMTELPAPVVSKDGDITTYAYESPRGPALNPVVSISDTRWAVSMPKEFGLEAIKASMAAPGQVAPMEFQLNIAPVAAALRGVDAANDDIKKAVKVLDAVNSITTGLRVTGRRSADGREVYHLHIISAGK